MKRFQRILAAVDLSEADRFVADDLNAHARQIVDDAIWLARTGGATIRFAYVVDSPLLQHIVDEEQEGRLPEGCEVVSENAHERLQMLVDEAKAQGVKADKVLRFGKTWVQLVREVLQNPVDVTIAGTRRLGPLRAAFMGSTSLKLLRKCPSPVWITKPRGGTGLRSILVAHDLTDVGTSALGIGAELAQMHDARLTVVHVLEHHSGNVVLPPPCTEADIAAARAAAEQRIATELAYYPTRRPVDVEIIVGHAAEGILESIAKGNVDLAVMGTVARTGIRGIVMGNTAEMVLPQVPCSVLAIKPSDFICPLAT
ncbi:MAG: universal stress protein [Pirellulaceae bacterium]|nr:universal stress protein [Planctomycetales bacterium]